MDIKDLRQSLLYSEELKIELRYRDDKEIFKWFLASLLFGGRITETIAKNTYRVFANYGLLNPRTILRAGWEFLVDPIMTANIFLRELRPYWKKADPEPLVVVKELARKCGVPLDQYNRKTLAFARIEAGLIRSRRGIEALMEHAEQGSNLSTGRIPDLLGQRHPRATNHLHGKTSRR